VKTSKINSAISAALQLALLLKAQLNLPPAETAMVTINVSSEPVGYGAGI